MSDKNEPHPDNAPGSFYVTGGCCTACGAPIDAAPGLFAYDRSSHCYVKRQPATPGETEQALLAVRRAELACIRYRGADPGVLQRFAELGQLELCDAPEARSLRTVLRNHVAFGSTKSTTDAWTQQDVAEVFAGYVRSLRRPVKYRVTALVDNGSEALLKVAWYEENFHPIYFRRVDSPEGRWLVWHLGNLGVSELIDGWLKADVRFSDIRWYAVPPSDAPSEWRETPW
jgi:hypothetical protein